MAEPKPEWDFLEGEFLTLSINAALQHSSTYATEGEKDRETVRLKLRCVLCDLAKKYASGVDGRSTLKTFESYRAAWKRIAPCFSTVTTFASGLRRRRSISI